MKRPEWLIRDPPPAEDLLEALVGPKGRTLPSKIGGLQELARASPEELRQHLTPAKALRLAASVKLHQVLSADKPRLECPISCASDVFDLYKSRFLHEQQEHFYCLLLAGKHRLKKEVLISTGTLTASIVHPREVFAPAIKERAGAVLVVHNHPSGDPVPSSEDFEITCRLKEVGELVRIKLLDHVVIGKDRYYSFQEGGTV